MNTSSRLDLPFIAPSQAQKHVTHNEALRQLDLVVQLSVEQIDAQTPPASPQEGEVHALGAAPLDDWAGHAGLLAIWQTGAWVFTAPQIGWLAWDRGDAVLRVWNGARWQGVPPAPGTLQSLGINTDADDTNRLALASDASLFTHDGNGHQVKVNKAATDDTASLLFQNDFSGRAEMGLAGGDNFSVKVSADGTAWQDAMVIDAATGKAGFGTPSPTYNVHVSGATSYLALEDSNGALGGSMSAAVRLLANGAEHGQLGFPGTGTGTMYLRNLQGDMYIEADSRNLNANSFIRFAVDNAEMMRVRPNGVGVGTISPARPLHVDAVMRLEPSSAPANPAAGDIYFDAGLSKLRCHDGTVWHDLF